MGLFSLLLAGTAALSFGSASGAGQPADRVVYGHWTPWGPAPREGHSAIVDPVRKRIVLFGGDIDDASDETWVLPLEGEQTWTPLIVAGDRPLPRTGHSAIYDPVGDRMIIFGGRFRDSAGGTVLDDVWALSLSGTPVWTRIDVPGPRPAARAEHSAIYDAARRRMVIFAGGASGYMGDVWALSLGSPPAWEELNVDPSPTDGPCPERVGHCAVFDSDRDRMVVFGGEGPSANNVFNKLGDTWVLSFADLTWAREYSPQAPGAREEAAAVVDPSTDRMILFGGYGFQDYLRVFDDAWSLDLATLTWAPVAPAGEIPEQRYRHGAIWDETRSAMVIYGGRGSISVLNDCWRLTFGPTAAWSRTAPTGGLPHPREFCSGVYDPIRHRMLVTGGVGMVNSSFTGFDDVWALTPGPPIERSALGGGGLPAGSASSVVVLDPIRDRLLAMGPYDGSSGPSVFTASPTLPSQWAALATQGTPPTPRRGASAVYDSRRDRVLLFAGGWYDGVSWNYDADVWELALSGTPTWTRLAPAGPAPSAREGQSAVIDGPGERMIVFGGMTNSNGNQFDGDLWSLSLSDPPTWTKLATPHAGPSPRAYHAAVVDSRNGYMVLFGGWAPDVVGRAADVWSLSLGRTSDWIPLLPGGRTPPGRDGAGAVFDPDLGGMVVVGGFARGAMLADAWTLDLSPIPAPTIASVDAKPQVVRLVWSAPGAEFLKCSVERRGLVGSWGRAGRGGSVLVDAAGLVAWEDSTVAAGQTYAYRLTIGGGPNDPQAGVWVTVPAGPSLALSVGPNPAVGPLSVTFELPSTADARLALYDVAGREVRSADLLGYSTGTHTYIFTDTNGLAAGIYVLRLTQGNHSKSAKVAVLR